MSVELSSHPTVGTGRWVARGGEVTEARSVRHQLLKSVMATGEAFLREMIGPNEGHATVDLALAFGEEGTLRGAAFLFLVAQGKGARPGPWEQPAPLDLPSNMQGCISGRFGFCFFPFLFFSFFPCSDANCIGLSSCSCHS